MIISTEESEQLDAVAARVCPGARCVVYVQEPRIGAAVEIDGETVVVSSGLRRNTPEQRAEAVRWCAGRLRLRREAVVPSEDEMVEAAEAVERVMRRKKEKI